MNLRNLVGSGDRIGLIVLPFAVIGLTLNIAFPAVFDAGGPPAALLWLSMAILVVGVVVWAWSVFLILTKVPRHELIRTGPFAVVRHPLYTGVALLVLPWLGFVLNSWLGVVLGVVVYVGSRMFAPAEEATLSRTFGPSWDAYRAKVILPWL